MTALANGTAKRVRTGADGRSTVACFLVNLEALRRVLAERGDGESVLQANAVAAAAGDDIGEVSCSARAISYVALALVLARYGADICDRPAFERTATGKPYLPGGPHFSLSRTAGMAAIAISRAGPVGIDIERKRDLALTPASERSLKAAAGQLATRGTYSAASRSRCEANLRNWVRLEAAVKANGGTMAKVIDRPVASSLYRGNMVNVCRRDAVTAIDLDAPSGYVAAVSAAGWHWDVFLHKLTIVSEVRSLLETP